MNIDTGHLINTSKMTKEEVEKLFRNDYIPVPHDYQKAADKILAGREEAYVSMTSGGKLSKFAAEKRRDRRKAVVKAAKEARRKNRKK